MSSVHTTAGAFWDTQWRDPARRAAWETPEPWVLGQLEKSPPRSAASRALDIGCGAGRHTLALAQAGYAAYGCDTSPSSVALVTARLETLGSPGLAVLAPMDALPFATECFEYVLAWNVLYHGTWPDVVRAVSGALAVLAPGGTFQATFLSPRNQHCGRGRSLDDRTWIDETQGDKAHPHCYTSQADLEALFKGVSIETMEEYEQSNYPEAWHWHVTARKELHP